MKKYILVSFILLLILNACVADSIYEIRNVTVDTHDTNVIELSQIDMSDFYVYTDESEIITGTRGSINNQSLKNCYTMKNLNRLLKKDKGLEKRMYDIEFKTRNLLMRNNFKPGKGNGGGNGGGNGNGGGGGTDPGPTPVTGIVNIPVVVHVLYNNQSQNISDSQIASQIQVLNDDFNARNSDVSMVPFEFSGDVGNSEIEFTLAQIIRKETSVSAFGTNDAIKFSSQGGSDVVSPETYLNIWVGNIGGGILGYAQYHGGSSSNDVVVIVTNYFGTNGTATSPFDKGRTGTHEVGHWLNLRHIWGDGRCKRDDYVADTPNSDRPNYSCPSYPTVHCRSNDMTMNYMDYTNDACMYMFTNGQKDRMRALFVEGGARASFITP